MAKVLQTLTRAERKRQEKAYLEYLKVRDGSPDLRKRTLSNREAFFNKLDANPIKWDGKVPVEEFKRVLAVKKPQPGFSTLALWMAVMARTNESEQYVVNVHYETHDLSNPKLDDPMTYVELEEFYHTRILLDSLKTLGLDLQLEEPKGVLRQFLNVIGKLPFVFTHPLALLGEICAVLLFIGLRDHAIKLFGTDNPAGKRIVSLLDEILIDEVGHMSYVRTQLGPVRMWIARNLVRFAGKGLLLSYPTTPMLFDVDKLAKQALEMDFDIIPAELRARAFNPETGVVPEGAHAAFAA